MGEPFSIAANIVAKANVKSGDKAVIFGAGTIGVAVLQVLKKQGIKVLVTDIADVKLKIAENFGADAVVNSTKQNLEEEVEKFSEGGVEAVIDAVGMHFTFAQAVKLAAPCGTIVEIGFDDTPAEIPAGLITRKELTIAGSRMNCHRFGTVSKWLEDGTITDKMISAVYPLDEIQTAFEYMLARSDHWLKVIIRIDEKEK